MAFSGSDRLNLVPRAFPLKMGGPHPFFKGKALGTRLGSPVNKFLTTPAVWGGGGGGRGGVLRISSDRDDRMGAKVKTRKNPYLGLPTKSKTSSLDQ